MKVNKKIKRPKSSHFFTATEINLFSNILQLEDADIYDWYTKKKILPKEEINSVIIQLLNFKPYK
jgi:succinate dehydrogenase flavin-adding protein (antitoxin of CptAB toxin-antitoxin module)